MQQFQGMMSRFLETQRNVMLTYLESASSATTQPAMTAQPSPMAFSGHEPAAVSLATVVDSNSHAPVSAPTDAPPAAEVAGLSRAELITILLEIVSERTGYPTEMLDLDLDLEASLGIDSIKRVEILGQLRQPLEARSRNMQDLPMDELTASKTLRGIVDLIDGLSISRALPAPVAPALPTRPADAPAQAPAMAEQARIQRMILRAVPRPLSGGRRGLAPARVVLITDDGAGVADRVAEALRRMGHAVALLTVDGGDPSASRYSVDLTSESDVERALAQVRATHGPAAALLHLLPLRLRVASKAIDVDTWRASLALEGRGLFLLARALRQEIEEAAQEGAALIGASAMGGAFASDQASLGNNQPAQGAITGLIKSIAREWPAVRARAVDLDLADGPDALADHLLAELLADDAHAEIGYRAGQRLVLELQSHPADITDDPALGQDSVLLITGGARGITADVAIALARRYQPTLILVGRSLLPPDHEAPDTAGIEGAQELRSALIGRARAEGRQVTPAEIERLYQRLQGEREMRQTMAALSQAGARVQYHALDVRDTRAFGDLISQIYAEHGRIDGVIHGAGIIEDKLLKDKTTESFDRVVATKVEGAFALAQYLRPEQLRFLIFFASVSGRFGNRGQADYAAANEVLSKLAAHLDQRWPARVVAISWGPWDKRGMVSPEMRREFARRGVALIPPDIGCEMLVEEIRQRPKGTSEVVVVGEIARPDAAPARPAIGFPLLAGLSPITRGGSIEIERAITLENDIYLLDHKLDGKPVLPFAMALELMAELAQQAWPDLTVVGLREMRVYKGIVIDSNPITVRITARAQTDAPTMHAGANVSVEIADAATGQRHYRVTVELADRMPEAPIYRAPFANRLLPFQMSADEAYQRWLFHGPLFAGISQVAGIAEDGIAATLQPSDPAQCLRSAGVGGWLIDPVVFDSGLQLIILWTRAQLDMTPLPARFRRYQRFGPMPAEPVQSYVEVHRVPNDPIFRVDIAFVGLDGRLIGLLEEMECPASRALNRLAIGANQELGEISR
jgi:NAD(P)-dependent dehydrogenase (short-subunit alcohol dehydrogenase family)